MDGRLAFGIAAGLSLLLHGGSLAFAPGEEAVMPPPSAGGEVALLGNAFADMAAGSVSVIAPGEDATQPVTPETQPPVEDPPDEAEPSELVQTEAVVQEPTQATPIETNAPAPEPVQTATLAPTESTPAPIEPAQATAVPLPTTTSATEPTLPTTANPDAPETVTATSAPSPQETATVQTVSPQTVTQALPDNDPLTSIYAAPRPPARPDDRVPEEMLQPEPEPVRREPERQEQPPAQPEGNADANQVAGIQSGTQDGDAPTEGQGNTAQVTDDGAAAANYPGLVMARLSQTRRERVDGRGTAVIAFNVAANGNLAGINVAQSSGNASVDNAGLSLVQRAAPFPAPPAGAQQSFSFRFTGE